MARQLMLDFLKRVSSDPIYTFGFTSEKWVWYERASIDPDSLMTFDELGMGPMSLSPVLYRVKAKILGKR